MDDSSFNILEMVSEGTEVTVLTGLNILWEVSAEFCLIFFNVI